MKKNHAYGLIIIVVLLVLTGCTKGESAKSYHKTGIKHFQKGEYEEAEENLLNAVNTNPNKAEYYIDYGFALIKTNQFDEAHIQFNKAIFDKNNKVVRENNKMAHRGKGIAYYEVGEYEKAIHEFEEALKIKDYSHLNKDLLYYKGLSLEKAGFYQEALDVYNTILDDMKPNDTIYGMIGRMQYYLGEIDLALKSFDKAIKFDEDAYEYYFEKYAILVEKGDVSSADEVLSQAFSIKAKTKEDKYNLAKLTFLSGDYKSSETMLKESTKEGFAEAYYYLGEISQNSKNYQSAIQYYKEYLQKESNIKIITVYNQLTVCLMENSEYEEAFEVLTVGLKQKDASILREMQYNEVALLENLSRFDEAYTKAKEYLTLYPEDKEMIRELEFLNTRVSESKSS